MTRLRRGVLLTLPGTTLPGLSAYAAFLAIERLDSSATLGYLSLAWVVTNISSAVVAQGPAHTALRTISGGTDHDLEVRARYRTLVLRRAIGLGGLLALAALATWPVSTEMASVLAASIPWMVGQSLVLFETETLRAAHRYGAASTLVSVRAIAGWGASVAIVALVGGLWAAVLPTAIVGLAAAAIVSGGRWEHTTEADREACRTIGRPLGQLAVASYVLGYGDRFVVQAFLGPVAVATYTLGYQLGEGAMELATAPLTTAALPKVVGAWRSGPGGPGEARQITRRLGLGILALAAMAPVVVLVLAPTGIFDWISTNPEFPAVVAIVAAAVGLQSITRLVYGLLLADGRTQRILVNSIIGGIISVGAGVVLTWQYGIVGAAWATLAGYASLAALSVWTVRRA